MKTLSKLNPSMPQPVTELFKELTAGATGLTMSTSKDIPITAARIAQRIVSQGFTDAIKSEWEYLVEKGKIKDTYSPSATYNLQELLHFLEEDLLDNERFELLKKIFFVTITGEYSKDTVTPQEYMNIARELSSAEILVLNADYFVYKNHPEEIETLKSQYRDGTIMSTDGWQNVIASYSGLKHKELVNIQEKKLVEKQLLTPPTSSGFLVVNPYFRLTGLGYGLCEFIANYDNLPKKSS